METAGLATSTLPGMDNVITLHPSALLTVESLPIGISGRRRR